jgi:dCTP deaminase
MFQVPHEMNGILPIQWLKKAVEEAVIHSKAGKIPDSNFQPASLDLRLGEKAYRLRCSFLPGAHRVQDKLDDQTLEEIDIRDGAILESNRPYLIPLMEELQLPEYLHAKANPKSSTGRLDVFTRVITDQGRRFDEIRPGYRGKMYLEVAPRSFTVKVRTGLSLNQLRLIKGVSQCSDTELLQAHRIDPMVFSPGGQLRLTELDVTDGVSLSIDLIGDGKGVIGYKARKNSDLIDLSRKDYYDAAEFWEPIYAERMRRLILEPEEFYLLLSYESVKMYPQFAGEMTALNPSSGEFRTHYAGFFDPGFGYGSKGEMAGTRAVMEIRAHDVPFMLENRQQVCQLRFERMLECPDLLYGAEIGSSYYDQGLRLSKHFNAKTLRERPQLSLL